MEPFPGRSFRIEECRPFRQKSFRKEIAELGITNAAIQRRDFPLPVEELRKRYRNEDDVREFLTTVFADAGATVISAAGGDEALAKARAEKPDLISLDLSMPHKDGVETFYELRQTAETQVIPVCIVTGHPEFREVIAHPTLAQKRMPRVLFVDRPQHRLQPPARLQEIGDPNLSQVIDEFIKKFKLKGGE